MPVQFADPKERAFQTMLAKDKVRLRNPQTGELLHLSGQGTTSDVTWSWLGYIRQAETLRTLAEVQGDDWPFVPVHRNLLDPVREAEE